MKKTLALLLMFVTGSSLGASIVRTEPVAPTSITPVTLIVTTEEALCPSGQDARVEGATITYTITAASVCQPLVPGPSRHTAAVGELAPGLYAIRVQVKHGDAIQVIATGSLVVRPATTTITVEPSFVYGIGGPVRITGGLGVTSLLIGGVSVPFTASGSSITANAPSRTTTGLVDVTLRFGDGSSVTQPGALLYLDSTPPPSVVEPVLFPVLDTVRGAFGSEFVSEAAIYNGNSSTVLPVNPVFPLLLCSPTPFCDQAFVPGSYRAFRGDNHPQGVLMAVSRDQAANMSYTLRVRDTSRGTADYGAEIPVVRERDFKTATFPLLDVPVLDTFRTKVRIYAMDALPSVFASLQISRATDLREPIFAVTVPLEPGACDGAELCDPAYGEVDLQSIAQLRGIERVVVFVTVANARSWAFATVTNNTTQTVTTVTPR